MRNSLIGFICLIASIAGRLNAQQQNRPIYFLCPPCGNFCDTIHFSGTGICPYCGMQLYAAYGGYENKTGTNNTHVQKNVAILVWPGVQIIDFTGPYEVFGQAGMNVYTVGPKQGQIEANMHLKIYPDYSFDNAPQPDILVLPGGSANYTDPAILKWIKKTDSSTEHTMSVCTGAFYLAASGLLNNLKATTFYTSIGPLQKMVPTAIVEDTIRFADNGHIITSAGLSSGIDAALHVVSLYLGAAATKKIANDLEYNWNDEAQFVRGKQADKYLLGFVDVFTPFNYKITTYKGDEQRWDLGVTVKTQLSAPEVDSLLAYQMEKGEKWVKRGPKTWQFASGGYNWAAVLDVTSPAKDVYAVSLKIKKR